MALQVERSPTKKLSLRFDGVLASLYTYMINVHQHVVPRSWGIVLNICYMNATTTDFLEFERWFERPIQSEFRRLSLFLNPGRRMLRWQDIKLPFNTALINT